MYIITYNSYINTSLSLYLSIYLSIYLSLYLSIYIYIYMYVKPMRYFPGVATTHDAFKLYTQAQAKNTEFTRCLV